MKLIETIGWSVKRKKATKYKLLVEPCSNVDLVTLHASVTGTISKNSCFGNTLGVIFRYY
jgi:hypothetical protein